MKTKYAFLKTLLSLLTYLFLVNVSQAQINKPPKKPNTNKKKTSYDPSVPAPTLVNIRYGKEHRNFLDFWKAPSTKPTPLVLVIHGGGWNGGSKEIIHKFVDTQALINAGISVAAINYRFIKHCKDLDPHVKGPMSDATRALQFIRSNAKKWNLDKTRIALTGGSAGGCTSLWLAYHDDLAKPNSQDPIEHESTKPFCVAVSRPQTTLDPKQMKEWITNSKYGAHAFGIDGFEKFLDERDSILPTINAYSPYALLNEGDPPTYMFFTKTPSETRHEKDPTHSAIFGLELQKQCEKMKVACEVVYPGAKRISHKTITDYLIKTLNSKKRR